MISSSGSGTTLGRRDCRCGGDGGAGRPCGELPSTAAHLFQRQADVGNGASREGGEVPDGLSFGVQFSDIPEHGRPGHKAQLRPLHGHGLTSWRLPERVLALPRAKDTPPNPTAWASDEDAGGQDIYQVVSHRAKSGQTGGAPQLMDLGGDVYTHQQESLREAGTWSGPYDDITAGMVNS